MLTKMLVRRASHLDRYEFVDVDFETLLKLAGTTLNGIIISKNNYKGFRKILEDNPRQLPFWIRGMLAKNNDAILNYLNSEDYVITLYDDWVE